MLPDESAQADLGLTLPTWLFMENFVVPLVAARLVRPALIAYRDHTQANTAESGSLAVGVALKLRTLARQSKQRLSGGRMSTDSVELGNEGDDLPAAVSNPVLRNSDRPNSVTARIGRSSMSTGAQSLVAHPHRHQRHAKARTPATASGALKHQTSLHTIQDDWDELTDATSGKTYYYNRVSGDTQWDTPTTPPPTQGPPRDDGWEALTDPSTGATYYHNTSSGLTQWDLPSTAS